jgi:hypothetical protein
MTKYRTAFVRIAVCSALAAMLPSVVYSQVVSEKVRQDRIAAISKVLDVEKPDADALVKDLRDPFVAKLTYMAPGASAANSGNDGRQGSDVAAAPEALMKEAAKKLCPAGLMAGGARKLVVTADGSIHAVGEPFALQLDKALIDVVIVDAAAGNFVLKYQNETMTIEYDQSVESEGSATKAVSSPEPVAR